MEQKRILEEKLKKESIIVQDDSVSVLKEIEDIDYTDQTI